MYVWMYVSLYYLFIIVAHRWARWQLIGELGRGSKWAISKWAVLWCKNLLFEILKHKSNSRHKNTAEIFSAAMPYPLWGIPYCLAADSIQGVALIPFRFRGFILQSTASEFIPFNNMHEHRECISFVEDEFHDCVAIISSTKCISSHTQCAKTDNIHQTEGFL